LSPTSDKTAPGATRPQLWFNRPMAIQRRSLLAGALALMGLIWSAPAAFGNEISLGKISLVKTGSARVFSAGSTRVLVFRRSARKFSGFVATCPSDQTKLTAANVRGGRITCPGDASVFNAVSGAKVSGPATTNLEKVPLKIANGFLVATIGAASAPAASAAALIESSKVPVGGGVKVESSAGVLMIVQPTKGKFSAYSAICTHLGCEVDKATTKAIICPCHNSQFSTDSGAVVSGPADRPLKSFALVERGGALFLK